MNESSKAHASNGHTVKSARDGNQSSDSVLIISDDAEFARTVVGRWQTERTVPAFTLMGSDLFNGAMTASHSLTILGPRIGHLPALIKAFEAAGDSVICVTSENHAAAMRDSNSRLLLIHQADGWVDNLVQLASEVLRCSTAMNRMQHAEQNLAISHRHATLGRYMLEMRHSLNNCLTSVLGNAELLLMEPGRLTADTREQIETIHTMSLRIHEVMQRFSSLESEMQFAEMGSHSETEKQSHASLSQP